MADDIVTRLRFEAVWYLNHADGDVSTSLAEAADEIERLTKHSIILNRVSWQLHDALGMIPEGADRFWGDIEAQLPTVCEIVREARRV